MVPIKEKGGSLLEIFLSLISRTGGTTYLQDKGCKMKMERNIIFGLMMPHLDALYLKEF